MWQEDQTNFVCNAQLRFSGKCKFIYKYKTQKRTLNCQILDFTMSYALKIQLITKSEKSSGKNITEHAKRYSTRIRRKREQKEIQVESFYGKSNPHAKAYCTQPRPNHPNSLRCHRTSMLVPRTRHFPNGM